MKIAIYTLGCKLNQAESDELKETLQNEGFFIVGWKSKADIYVVNACSLTYGAEQGTRQIIHQAHRKNPKAKIFVTGCFKQKLPEINYYNNNQNDLIKKIKVIAINEAISFANDSGKLTKQSRPLRKQRNCHGRCRQPRNDTQSRTRAFIKIQTGCDNFCSFCVIPHFRGKPKSIPIQNIINAVNKKVAQGFKEIVLTGVNICKYGIHNSKPLKKYKSLNLTELVKKILNETTIQRIRFGSLDPSLIDDNFISLFKNQRLMPHMHLSLQSGSSRILKLMNRKYSAKKYLSLIKKIKKQFPLMGFTTDVIVGFPGETEKDFHNTCDLVKKVGFLKVHIFPFSPRPGTVAEKLPHQIKEKTKKERFLYLKKISDTARNHFIKKMIGKNMPVLFEEKQNNYWYGYTPNYLRIKFKSEKNLKNRIETIVIKRQNVI